MHSIAFTTSHTDTLHPHARALTHSTHSTAQHTAHTRCHTTHQHTPALCARQSGILAVAGIHEGVEMVDGAPTAVSRMAATLTGDARIYDGQLAADFLNAFKHNLESPADLV